MARFAYNLPIPDNAEIIWKTEGLPDAWTLVDLELPEGHCVTTNGCGAGERPDKPDVTGYLEKMRGKEVFVVHDCDTAGQEGAIGKINERNGKLRSGWATEIAKYAAVCRNVVLPFEIQESGGLGLADYIERERAFHTDKEIYANLLEIARNSPIVQPPDPAEVEQPEKGIEPTEDVDDPHRLARSNLANYEADHGGRVVYWRQDWWRYRDGHYRTMNEDNFRAKVTSSIKRDFDDAWHEEVDRYLEWVESAEYDDKKDKGPPKVRKVTRNLTTNVIDATKSECRLSDSYAIPCWIPDGLPRNWISLANGILSLDEISKLGVASLNCLRPHTSDWFSPIRLPYAYDPLATCPQWKRFLDETFAGNEDVIRTLQQWFGYLLLPDTSQQKMMFVIGQPRSGKGTISRITKEMLGPAAVANPSLGDLACQYGLHPLIGKTVALINDVRLSKKADDQVIAERLLAISGEDSVDIQRKYKSNVTSMKLPVRFMLFANHMPTLNDTSSAIVPRCIILETQRSFVGREDTTLTEKLLEELPGILNWAIAGRESYLCSPTRKIQQPESGKSALVQWNRETSPVASFIDDCCIVAANGSVEVNTLFAAWNEWRADYDIGAASDIRRFSKLVHDVNPAFKTSRPRVNGERCRVIMNLALRKVRKSDELSEVAIE
jgi:putative DNA primase/helicase